METELRPPDWATLAECRHADPDIFFPERGTGYVTHYRQAREFCRVCPVKSECLTFAEEEHIVHGMWGGLSPRERRRLRKSSKPVRLWIR